MIKNKRGLIEWVGAILLLAIVIKSYSFSGGGFSATEAHKRSEETFHYGPSNIVKVIEFDESKLYLANYKDWFSLNQVKKGLIKWYSNGGVAGRKIKKDQQVTYSYRIGTSISDKSKESIRFFGYVSDEDIEKIILERSLGEETVEMEYEVGEGRMFVFYWLKSKDQYDDFKRLKGVNKFGEIIYQHNL